MMSCPPPNTNTSANNKNEVKELLEWELSLDSRDLRAHPWYHGRISRESAEKLLVQNGDFLVRDQTGRVNDYVLSCKWEDNCLHFLIHKDISQKDTIYEQLRFRFENDCFDTIPDLITYHVGSEIPISSGSSALIHNPRNRTTPLLKVAHHNLLFEGARGDYVSLMRSNSGLSEPAFATLEKISTLERLKQKSLNLNPPPGLIQDLEYVPPELALKMSQVEITNTTVQDDNTKKDSSDERAENGNGEIKSSNYDLASFQSILFPTNVDLKDLKLNKEIIETVTSRIMETNVKKITLLLSKLDYEILTGSNDNSKDDEEEKEETETSTSLEKENPPESKEKKKRKERNIHRGDMYALLFHDSQHRWNNIIERSLSLSHFVVITIIFSSTPEAMINKWILIAEELKSAVGNFFSFCSIMRGLLMPNITRSDGKVNWMRLRQDYTTAAFTFETALRGAYQGLIKGSESYPPNTTIPELFSVALIYEDAVQMMPYSCISTFGDEDQLEFFYSHLKQLRLLSSWSDIQKRNLERQLNVAATMNLDLDDLVLAQIFRTEFHLLLICGHEEYQTKSLKERCNLQF